MPVSASWTGRTLATLRWRRRAAHGLVFRRSFRLDELAELVGHLREAAC
ncbi:MAG: hypothetical protein ACK4YM_08290 [Novosphingobium sp.]